ncbi:MAG: DUF2807 domain-containing protein [Bauldia sp.]|nr:DUF2807 domain-containing protein [Bauldia sp.]
MTIRQRIAAVAGAFVVAAALAGCGGGEPVTATRSFAADALILDRFIGTLTIETGGAAGSIEVELTATEAQADIMPMTVANGTLTIRWEGEPDRRRRFYEFWRGRWMVGLDDLGSYPRLTIRLPADMPVETRDLFARFDIADRTAPLTIGLNSGVGSVGTTVSTTVSVVGDGTVELAEVSERLVVSIAGSGDVSVDGAAAADLSIAGSGNIDVGNAGEARIAISGSGDVAMADVASVALEVNGSGNVRLGAVTDFVSRMAGSGDVSIASVTGRFSASVAGSSNIVVASGRGAPFEVSVAGSGDVRFEGIAVDPEVRVSGSGDVFLGRVEGDLDSSTSGSGTVTVGE